MAKFNIVRTQRTVPGVATGVRANIDVDTGGQMTAGAISGLGKSVMELGRKWGDIQVNREVAEGLARYNNIINTFNENLSGKNPKDYMPAFEELKPEIEGITKDMTKRAGEILKNRFVVLNESNRASTAILAIQNTALLAKQEIPERLSSFASQAMSTDAMIYIDGFSDILSKGERDFWKETYQKMENKNIIFNSIIMAADNPTEENIKTARAAIDEFSEDEIDRYYNLNRLQAEQSAKTEIRNETYKAKMNEQSVLMANSYNSNMVYDNPILPELNWMKDAFDARTINGTLDVSDGVTYKSVSAQIDSGEYFSPYELASAYATGMSKSEYEDTYKRNEDNRKLTVAQRESIAKFASYITDRYNNMLSSARAKIPTSAIPEVMAAVDADKAGIRKKIIKLVKEGETDANIYKEIENTFIGDSSGFYKNWFMRWLMPGKYEIEAETREIGEREERYEIIMEILKSGKPLDMTMLGRLMEVWYK